MKVLIDVGHPIGIHILKNLAWILEKKKWQILFTAIGKDVNIPLLQKYGFNFEIAGRHYKNILAKAKGLIERDWELLRIAKNFKPDLFLSNGSVHAAHVAFLLRKPHISFEETGNLDQVLLYKYFVNAIVTPNCINLNLGKRHIKYNGYAELAYLHPSYFNPDPAVLDELGLGKKDTFVLVRFVSWAATHDMGHSGIAIDNKRKAVKEFSKYARVFISSEIGMPSDLEQFRLRISPEKLHHIIYYAAMTYGEGAAVAVESAVLGTPSIYLYTNGTYATRDLESRYGAIFNFTESYQDQLHSIQKGVELLRKPDIKAEWQKKREQILKDKIDVTAFMVWFVENYPHSLKAMKTGR